MPKNLKRIMLLAALWMLLGRPSVAIINCIKQDRNSANQSCSICYNSRVNRFGGCTPNWSTTGCLLLQSNVNKTIYAKSHLGYLLNKKTCSAVSGLITDCLSHIILKKEGQPDEYRCQECSNGIPSPSLRRCLPWSSIENIKGDYYLRNCSVGRRTSSIPSEGRCSVCKPRHAFHKKFNSCFKVPTEGCWEAVNRTCISCRA